MKINVDGLRSTHDDLLSAINFHHEVYLKVAETGDAQEEVRKRANYHASKNKLMGFMEAVWAMMTPEDK